MRGCDGTADKEIDTGYWILVTGFWINLQPASRIQNQILLMKIDIHTHIMPEKMPNWTEKFGYGEFIHLEHRECDACMMKGDKVFRVVGENSFKEEVRRKEMEETNVTVQVLSTIPVLFNYWAKGLDGYQTSIFFNDHIAETVAKEP